MDENNSIGAPNRLLRLAGAGRAAGRAAGRTAPAVDATASPVPAVKQAGRRYRIKLSNGQRELVIDSHEWRVGRARTAIRAWAGCLPRLGNRRQRRLLAKRGIEPRMVMVTLTYRTERDWQANDIRDLMKKMRRGLGEKLLAYAWCCEMQNRGVPHYHILLYVAPKTDIPSPDKCGWWPHGTTRRETVRTAFYISKYTGKAYQKEGLPHGARMFAVWVSKNAVTPDDLLGYRLDRAPQWLQQLLREMAKDIGNDLRWKRVKGGGWIIENTGEVVHSGYMLTDITEIKPPGVSRDELRQASVFKM